MATAAATGAYFTPSQGRATTAPPTTRVSGRLGADGDSRAAAAASTTRAAGSSG